MTRSFIPTVLLSFGLTFSLACDDSFHVMVTPKPGVHDASMLPDMLGDLPSSGASCSAATGVTGVLLKDSKGQDFCIDFNKVTDMTLKDSGWNLIAGSKGCSGFSVSAGSLNISSTGDYLKADCEADLPTLKVPAGTRKIVVSIIQNLALPSDTQSGQIEDRSTGQKYGWSGVNNANAPSANILEFDLESVPTSFAVALHARNTDTKPALLPTWQIRSIAVLGIQ